MTFKYRYRKQIILGVLLLVLIGGVIVFLICSFPKNEKKKVKEIVLEKKDELKKKEVVAEEKYQVDIKGEINSPGIYKVDSNIRVMDVIMLAGGLTDNADTSVINLSKKVKDEMVIIIYSKKEVANFKEVKEKEKEVNDKCIQKDENSLVNDSCINEDNKVSNKVSINTGTLEELMTLPFIGEAKAKDIISYREKNGAFQNIEDIKKVPGIGDSLFAKIKENITL